MSSESALLYFDITLQKLEDCNEELVKEFFKENCEQWCFQLEKGNKTGYLHYQARVKVKERKRASTMAKALMQEFKGASVFVSATSNCNKKNNFYVTKEDTRVEGPWSSEDVEEEKMYVPRQIREIIDKQDFKLHPWQQQVYDDIVNVALPSSDPRCTFNTRIVNIIIDKSGNNGKGFLRSYMTVTNLIPLIIPFTDTKDFMRAICDSPKRYGLIIDLPKAMKQDKLGGLFAGIEMVKDGYAADERYRYQASIFDSPNVWVFTNTEPEQGYLSKDRWRLYTINKKLELIPWVKEIRENPLPTPTRNPNIVRNPKIHIRKKE